MSDAIPEFDAASAVTIGRVLAPHGLRGEVKVEPLTDFPERFEGGRCVWVAGRPLKITAARWHDGYVYLLFEGIGSRAEAESLCGLELQTMPLPLEEGRYYRHDLIGLAVVDEQGRPLGRLVDILTTGANDVYVVRGDRGELLVPAISDVVKSVDLEARRIVVELMEGLEYQPPPKPRAPLRGTVVR